MSEKWTIHNTWIVRGDGTHFDAGTVYCAKCVVTAVNNHEPLVEFVKQVANHGNCRGFSADMVKCTAETQCGQCLSCAANAQLAKIEGEESKI